MEFIGFAPTLLLVNLSSMFYAPNNVNNGKISQRLACFKNKNIVSKFVFVGNTFSVSASTSLFIKTVGGVKCNVYNLGSKVYYNLAR